MNVYEIVTNRVIASLEKGIIPWQKPWKAEAGSPFPKNFFTGNAYRGVNVVMLWPGEFNSSNWLTFRQALAMGGHVRKGEKGTPIVFCKPVDPKEQNESEDKEQRRFIFRYSTVFNVEQCDGLPAPAPSVPRPEIRPIEHCEKIVDNWSNKPTLHLEHPTQSRAFYRSSTDAVHMPMRNRFLDAEHYYKTLFHELIHSTGHTSRLDRQFGHTFGDDPYSREELVAEMGAAFLSAIVGINNERTEENTTAYLQNWISVLKGDSRLIVTAASQAQRAVDMIVGTSAEAEEDGEGTAAGEPAVTPLAA